MGDAEATNDIDDVDYRDIVKFFKERGVKEECELCNAVDWGVASQIHGGRPFLPFQKKDETRSGAITLIITSCNNCGNIRSFNRFYFDQWLVARRPKGGVDG